MNQRLLWTTAVLLVTAIGTTSSSHAEQNPAVDQASEANFSAAKPLKAAIPVPTSRQEVSTVPQTVGAGLKARPSTAKVAEVVKVGEYQSQTKAEEDLEVIAKVQAHQIAGRQAATLYVRNIPVLTFLGASVGDRGRVPVVTGELRRKEAGNAQNPAADTQVKVAANSAPQDSRGAGNARVALPNVAPGDSQKVAEKGQAGESQVDPVWRASAIAAKLNDLWRGDVNSDITVSWSGEADSAGKIIRDRYLIQVNGNKLLVIDPETRLPDTTHNLAQDALQVTNRLRRLMANAPPLQEIANIPKPKPLQIAQDIAQELVLSKMDGWASWYGPGFHGNLSANGEIFDENAMTAAHLELPFGTLVRVTNLNNGLSVVVRINDRGPYVEDRIIDLSAGAAQVLGMMNSGVAPVRLDILGYPNAAAGQ